MSLVGRTTEEFDLQGRRSAIAHVEHRGRIEIPR
jgi:hypothetical protein